ncbi:Alpha/beta hydrolase fold-3 domain protein [Sulfitobacter noctilucicola]|uniref:Acetyl esterase n=1 Tax=Sulfitobacter noctilucicola TaxID=1342301 RepID=A0A7W6M8R4_9RHOB|nr:alpha/beta hydrolase [Sulfitobacter noctilucicola]KIN64279.1 Alpha/beta hydrolase fold-3 domain protein [Sulfitobacter noctilucicola]MBB4174553.1 acetyl esterase [Sulfitobacter noctilucicola]
MSTPDYATLIDDETWAYIARLDANYPPDAVDMSIADQRAAYDEMCAVFHAPRPEGVVVRDVPFGGVPCRTYSSGPSEVTVIYYHGGGFVVGGLQSHDDICAELCARTGLEVISVDYALAPETVFPGCFNDAWTAFSAITQSRSGGIVLCGDSAGGNLAAAVAHHARGRVDGRIVGQVLIYPGLGGDMSKGSYVTHANAPQLTMADLEFYKTVRTGGAPPPQDDPRFAPLADSDFESLPPTVLITAECDPLASDGESYRDALQAAGGKAVWFNEQGMVHACLRARNMSTRAAGFFDRVVDGVAQLGARNWPYDD